MAVDLHRILSRIGSRRPQHQNHDLIDHIIFPYNMTIMYRMRFHLRQSLFSSVNAITDIYGIRSADSDDSDAGTGHCRRYRRDGILLKHPTSPALP